MKQAWTTANRTIIALRGVAPSSRVPAGRAQIRKKALGLSTRAQRRARTGQVRLAQIAFGAERANTYFWKGPSRSPVWFDVHQRLDNLARWAPTAVDDFVEKSIMASSDPITIVGLARHPLSADFFKVWLAEEIDRPHEELNRRLQQNRLLGAAFAGAGAILLGQTHRAALLYRIERLYQIPDGQLYEFVASTGIRSPLSAKPHGDEFHDRDEPVQPIERRLIVADNYDDRDSIALLLPGASSTTLLSLADTFGKADFSSYEDWPGVGTVEVEHVRSRISRFSQSYVDLHLATSKLATSVASDVYNSADVVDADQVPFLEVEIADFLFFQALKIRSLEELIADSSFDEILVAVDNHRANAEYLRILAQVPGLLTDPRVKIVSISRSAASRCRFLELINELIRNEAAPVQDTNRKPPPELVLQKFEEEAQRLASNIGHHSDDERVRVTVVTANSPAHNESTAIYASDLAANHEVRILHIGRNGAQLAQHMHDNAVNDERIPIDFISVAQERCRPLAGLVYDRIRPAIDARTDPAGIADRAAHRSLQVVAARLTATTIAPALVRMRAAAVWLEHAVELRAEPHVIVLTPYRNIGVGSVCTPARRHGVPSVVLEPHAQDANYSRYLKIAADYYGTMSDYFSSQAVAGFGLPAERVITVGSPRQVAPPGYDPVVEQTRARGEHSEDLGINFATTTVLVFFCQPSAWEHVERVWKNILEAAKATECHILLKPHPEESISRQLQYEYSARELDAAELVTVFSGAPSTAIALADIVLTAYSAAAIDAAVRQRPVVSVSAGVVDYPVDLPAIVGASMTYSAHELAEVIRNFQCDPASFHTSARQLLQTEPQFVSGPAERVDELVRRIAMQGSDAVRGISDVPRSLFLDGPHPTFAV